MSTAELDEDLAALIGRPSTRHSGLRAPLGQAEAAFGRFFFVQRAQSIRDGRTLSTYEFLHATFGEYLAVRLAVRLVSGLLDHRPVLSTGREPLNDDLMFALLSFAPLFSGRCSASPAPASSVSRRRSVPVSGNSSYGPWGSGSCAPSSRTRRISRDVSASHRGTGSTARIWWCSPCS
ncbi:hypothetical protein SMD44_08334 [Streptomyces alboflavus]|uniref:Uncharacterized protein n=1 Tax=Streptomyces alboflavus TaxID=67267 RepID=A0A1Z1WR20_9ACTN|nr:hypothetical protein SMD44_08334 [Streptomyces alboflavus]